MGKAKYKHISLSQASRKILNVNKFGGVDLSSQKFNVSSGRAIDGQNFITKNGILQVREGFEELYNVSPFYFIERDFTTGNKTANVVLKNPVNFNGIWSFEAEDGNRHFIAHIGYLLYEIHNFGEPNMSFEVLSNDSRIDTGVINGETKTARLLYKYTNQRTSAFVGDKKLWFLGGNKYMVIRFVTGKDKVQPVEDSDLVFIPKTTQSITYSESQVEGREALDYPNMMTMFRRNSLLTGTGKRDDEFVETPYYEYTLDAPLLTKSNSLVNNEPTISAKQAFSKMKITIKVRKELA